MRWWIVPTSLWSSFHDICKSSHNAVRRKQQQLWRLLACPFPLSLLPFVDLDWSSLPPALASPFSSLKLQLQGHSSQRPASSISFPSGVSSAAPALVWRHLTFFLQCYGDVSDMQHCIHSPYSASWFNLHSSWNGDPNKFSDHPSSHIDTQLKK